MAEFRSTVSDRGVPVAGRGWVLVGFARADTASTRSVGEQAKTRFGRVLPLAYLWKGGTILPEALAKCWPSLA